MKITLNAVLEVAMDLLRIPSVNPRDKAQVAEEEMLGEVEICNFIASWLNKHKIPAEVRHYAPGRACCVAILENRKGPTLWLNGHVDTVAPTYLTKESFVPRVLGDNLYGIGAADMKGGVAAMLVALAAAADVFRDGRIIFSAVGGEEGPPSGTEFLLSDSSLRADMVVVGEPSHLALFIGQKGSMWVKIKCQGRARHGCVPDHRVNAVEGLIAYLYTLNNKDSSIIFQYIDDIYSQTTCNVGIFSGGHRPNIIPAEAFAILDIRYPPRCNSLEILEKLKAHAEIVKQNEAAIWNFIIEVIEGPTEPVYMPKDHPMVSKIAKIIRVVLKRPVSVGWAPYWSDAYYYLKTNIPTFIFGPGQIENAHQPEEYVSITDMWKSAMVYYKIITNLKEVVNMYD